MGQYQKFMFDNFVISCNEDECQVEEIVEPATIELEPTENLVEVEHIIEEVEEIVVPIVEGAPTYSQEEYNAAVKQAEERGYERGFHASADEKDALQQVLLDSINNRIMTLLAETEKSQEAVEQSSLTLLKEVIRQIFPSLEKEYALAEVKKFLGDNFSNFRHESSLVFSFNPEMIKNVQEIIAKLANVNDYEGKISIHKDVNLGLSDCKIEWKSGGVERNAHKTLEKIDNLLDDETII